MYLLEASEESSSSLTGQGGLLGTGIKLNGKLMQAGKDGTVPRPTTTVIDPAASSAPLPAYSIAFYVLPKAILADCPWSRE